MPFPYDLPMTKDAPVPFELPHWIALAPFEEYIGMKIESAVQGHAVLSMPFQVRHCQGAGLMHGGAIVSLADTALAIAIKTVVPEGTHFATIDMSLKFHAPVRWGIITAKAVVSEQTGRDISGNVEIVTEEGITAASFQALFRVGRKRTVL